MTEESRLEHFGISVADLERSVAWYRARFGFEESRRFERAEWGLKAAVLRLGADLLEIVQPERPLPAPPGAFGLPEILRPGGLAHLAIGVPDVAAALEAMSSSGDDLATGLLEGRLFFVRDPDGTLIEVRQRR
jgi:catechol 2,3-dioxygenase-like lactoylglutathione lyase family enzyme